MNQISTSRVSIIVSIDDEYLTQIQEVAQKLQSFGMSVERILTITGVITGSMASDKLDDLHQVEGVRDIEVSQNYQLRPPNSGIQ